MLVLAASDILQKTKLCLFHAQCQVYHDYVAMPLEVKSLPGSAQFCMLFLLLFLFSSTWKLPEGRNKLKIRRLVLTPKKQSESTNWMLSII